MADLHGSLKTLRAIESLGQVDFTDLNALAVFIGNSDVANSFYSYAMNNRENRALIFQDMYLKSRLFYMNFANLGEYVENYLERARGYSFPFVPGGADTLNASRTGRSPQIRQAARITLESLEWDTWTGLLRSFAFPDSDDVFS